MISVLLAVRSLRPIVEPSSAGREKGGACSPTAGGVDMSTLMILVSGSWFWAQSYAGVMEISSMLYI